MPLKTTAQPADIIIELKHSISIGHCALVTGTFPAGSTAMPVGKQVVHATTKGVLHGAWENGAAYVFRNPTLTRAEAEAIQDVGLAIQASASYGGSRAAFKSWTGSNVFGGGAMERLQKYNGRLHNHQGVLKNVFCSELVVIAYQLGLAINAAHAAWLPLDGRHTTPRALKTWLSQHVPAWTYLGKVDDASLAVTMP